ncbi:hypothetical protein FHU36_001541 [Nonomuraea muscovyensis]|uniref:Uncharacterized protein n=1 Tax=Nonomuraea muscovyensis TaxID=1124761 RepID=A0A7X0EUQ7_9ACTN|nr:hypothetical protein [Nonomuraea muscovyensis]
MILLITLMIVAVAATELVLHCAARGKESVESPAEIVAD